MSSTKWFLTLFSALTLTLVFANTAQAVSISPLTFQINVNPGDTIPNVVSVYNDSDASISVSMSAQDFTAAGENGQVLLEGTTTSKQFTLANWITLNPSTFTLAPRTSQTVGFTINTPTNAEPGGHYASILASVSASSGSGVGIAQRVGSLLLVSVAGQAVENLSVSQFSAPSFSEYGPDKMTALFTNNGTIHLQPRGFVTITDMFGRNVGQIDIPQLNVLPQSSRLIDLPVQIGAQFGRYQATLSAIYGSSNEPLSATLTYWVIPWKMMSVAGVILIILIVAIYRGRRRIGLAIKIILKGDKPSE